MGARLKREWVSGLGCRVEGVEFRRGFPWAVKLKAAAFVNSGGRIVDSAPVVEARLTRVREAGRRLADTPSLSKLSSLVLAGGRRERAADAKPLLMSRHLTGPRRLALGPGVGADTYG